MNAPYADRASTNLTAPAYTKQQSSDPGINAFARNAGNMLMELAAGSKQLPGRGPALNRTGQGGERMKEHLLCLCFYLSDLLLAWAIAMLRVVSP